LFHTHLFSISLGAWSYALVIYLLCNADVGDKELEREYAKV
jgi:hypothetical protein